MVAEPIIDVITGEAILGNDDSERLTRTWDAAIVIDSFASASVRLKVLDALQQALVPTMTLAPAPGGAAIVAKFHAGGAIGQCETIVTATQSAMLYALAQRQTVIRSLDRHLSMTQSFQGEAAAAIDRLHDELLLAAKVQRDFLPKALPQVEGVDAAVIFRPAGFVSGDIYDVFQLDADHIGFFLADAMGHGVPAALMTLFISGHMPRRDAHREGRIVSPGEALKRLNWELHEARAGATRFVTAVAGQINIRTRQVTVAAAGHPPPLLVSKHGLTAVDATGMLLGVVEDNDYPEVTFELPLDQTLLIHSDGVEVAFPEPLGKPKQGVRPTQHYLDFFAATAKARKQPASATTDMLEQWLDAQRGSINQPDDVTILALKTR